MKSGKESAGLVPYRLTERGPEVLLVHPGGPFWKNKDTGAWSIAKGEPEPGEDALAAAQRELVEETGFTPCGPFEPLGTARQKAGKLVTAWAFRADDLDAAELRCQSRFELEWPPRSGRRASFPEVDRAAWFGLKEAGEKLNPGQLPLLEALGRFLKVLPE